MLNDPNNINLFSDYNMSTSGSSAHVSTISIGDTENYSTLWSIPEEWVDSFPDWHRVQSMIEKYPSLKIALRNFEIIYKLVKDDYDTAADQES